MRKEKVRAALSFLAVACFLVGLAVKVALGGEEVEERETTAEGVYLVRQGDTLWAIAGRYLDNPRLWPSIWKQNPFVTNPHKIFPGDPLVIPGLTPPPSRMAEVPSLPEERVVSPAAPAPEAEPPPGPEEEVLPPVAAEAAPARVAELVEPEGLIKRPGAAPRLAIPRPALECSGFVAELGEVRRVGVIVRPVEAHERLWYGDDVFVDLIKGRKAERGDRFRVIRAGETVIHPVTGERVGVKLITLGTLEIVSTAGAAPRARIVYSCEDITLGDSLVEAKPVESPPLGLSRPTNLTVKGYIVGSKGDADSLGMGDIVYLDVGREKKIVPGDEFGIYRTSGIGVHPVTGRGIPLAPVKRGELVVIRSSAKSAAAVLTQADRFLHVGEERIVLIRKIP